METVKFENGRYSVDIPRNESAESIILPDHYNLSKARLLSLYKRLKIKNPDILEQYDRIFKEQEKEGVIEDANNETTDAGCVHYLPHREIIRDAKETTKMRIVFDGSVKLKYRFSLNDTLEKGPNMLPKIFDIIIRFLCYKYALISDIKSAFHCILVNKKDCDLTRFLWFDDIKSNDTKIIKKCHSSVIRVSSCTIFAKCNRRHAYGEISSNL